MKLSDKMAEHRELGCCSLESADWEGQVSQLEAENEKLKAVLADAMAYYEKRLCEQHGDRVMDAGPIADILDKAGA